ncbi:hypothetical protein IFR04_007207 [Cadophora malorum]|uniref:BTB domain-containing protein n=1 Tax=Cadophora malorum TaxID=108018 RepID=A0A8H7TDJ1_9HELO|nr:hypothetical protein IFR04_007207 [Cadophora malorum]
MTPPADSILASSPRVDRSLPRGKRKAAPVKSSLNLTEPQDFVTITAGQSKLSQDFIIHKSFLVHYSPFFQSAFETRFNTGSIQSMKLENVTPEVFGLIQHWVYLQKLPSPPLEAPSLENLAKVWLAAEHFQIQALLNHASGAICDRLTEFEGSIGLNSGLLVLDDQFDDYLACVKHIYFSTPAGEHKLKLLDSDSPVEPAHKKRGRPRRDPLPPTTAKVHKDRDMNSQPRPKSITATFASTNAPRNVTFVPGPPNARTPATRNPRTPADRDPGTSATRARITSQIEVQVPQNSVQALRINGFPQTTPKRKSVLKFWSKPVAGFVQLRIGPQAQVFSIHPELISHYSSFFRHAFHRQNDDKDQIKFLILKDVEVSVFGLFNQWLFTQEIGCEGNRMRRSKSRLDGRRQTLDLRWHLGRETEGPQKEKKTVLQQFVEHAYATKENTALKKLALHRILSFVSFVDNIKQWIDNFPPGMLAEFTVGLMRYMSKLPKNLHCPLPKQNSIYLGAAKAEVDLTG